jgi:hypothetical protein
MKLNPSKWLCVALASITTFIASNSQAWKFDGSVLCPSGTPYAGVVINVVGTNCNGTFTGLVTTDGSGNFLLPMPNCDGTFTATIDVSTLPPGATVINPGVSHNFYFDGAHFVVEGTINWTVDSSICGTTPPPPTNCLPVSSCTTSEFNGTAIPAGDTIWFNSVFKVSGLNSHPATILFDATTINFSVNGSPVTVTLPPAIITFSATATTASTTYNTGMGAWVTVVPDTYSGNVFLSGAAYHVPVNYPGGIKSVIWCGDFSADTQGLSVNWQWAAAVYTCFNSDLTTVGVKPVDDNKLSQYQNSDHAGTPENFKSCVTGGARGGGGSNFTGSYSGTAAATLCKSGTGPS